MAELTAIQQQIYEFIQQFTEQWQKPPTVHEIAEYMGYRSDNAAYQHLQALRRKGVLSLEGNSRGIRLLTPQGLPVIGQVSAGTPILAEENISNYIDVTPGLFRPKADFLLSVRGLSMRDAGILDGDLLAVHKTATAQQKQIVVARLENEVTVKRFKQRQNIVTLLPENPDFEPIRVDLRKQEFAIEGLVTGLIRDGINH